MMERLLLLKANTYYMEASSSSSPRLDAARANARTASALLTGAQCVVVSATLALYPAPSAPHSARGYVALVCLAVSGCAQGLALLLLCAPAPSSSAAMWLERAGGAPLLALALELGVHSGAPEAVFALVLATHALAYCADRYVGLLLLLPPAALGPQGVAVAGPGARAAWLVPLGGAWACLVAAYAPMLLIVATTTTDGGSSGGTATVALQYALGVLMLTVDAYAVLAAARVLQTEGEYELEFHAVDATHNNNNNSDESGGIFVSLSRAERVRVLRLQAELAQTALAAASRTALCATLLYA